MWLLLWACSSPRALWRPAVVPDPPLVDAEVALASNCVLSLDTALLGIERIQVATVGFPAQAWDLLLGPLSPGEVQLDATTAIDAVEVVLGGVDERPAGWAAGNASDAQVAALDGDALLVEGTLSCGGASVGLSVSAPASSWRCPAPALAPQQETASVYGLDLAAVLASPTDILAADADEDGVVDSTEWPLDWVLTQDGEDCTVQP